MYLTNIHNQLFSAALPLKPLTAWAGSACSVTVAVPPAPALAGLGVSSVGVTVSLPDGHTVAAAAVQVAGTPLWVATFAPEEFATSGHVAQGLMITVAGTDEHGTVRTWIVAKGDVDVVAGDAAPVSGGSYYAVKLRDEAPENPVEGDAYVSDGELSIYHDGEWVAIGGVDISGKLDSAAAYPAWDPSAAPIEGMVKSHAGKLWKCLGSTMDEPSETSEDWLLVTIGSLKQDALTSEQIGNINAVPGKAGKVVPSAAGNLAALNAQGNLADSGAKVSDFATPSDIPYRLVEPGKWEFSDGGAYSVSAPIQEGDGNWYLNVTGTDGTDDVSQAYDTEADALAVISFVFENSGGSTIIATRASIPGHLIDRAGNRVVVSGDTTLTLPAAVPGYLRDFIVRLEISGSTVPTITFAAPTGETITYETDGDEFPVPDEAGDWLYSFTESCVAHKFAVSLKKVNEVAAPQTQGGA